MNDRDLLEAVAQDAPAARLDYADEVLLLARRTRFRHLITGLAATVSLALGSAAVILAVSLAHRGHDTAQVVTTPPARASEPTAALYAASTRALAEEMRRGRSVGWSVLYILDHTCANILTPRTDPCAPRPLGDKLRSDLARALKPYAPVEYVKDAADVTGKDLAVRNEGLLVTLGPIRIDSSQAQVPISIRRNGLNGRGLTYRLTGHEESWTVVGTVGRAWIS